MSTLLLVLAIAVPPACGQDPLTQKLERPLTLNFAIDPNTPLQDALEYFTKTIGLPIHADRQALGDALQMPVPLPQLHDVRTATVLRLLLGQTGTTYTVRNGRIEIGRLRPDAGVKERPSHRQAQAEEALRRRLARRVTTEEGLAEGIALADALARVAEQFDINVALDGGAYWWQERKHPQYRPVKLPVMKDVPLSEVLDRMLHPIGAMVRIEDSLLLVVPRNTAVPANSVRAAFLDTSAKGEQLWSILVADYRSYGLPLPASSAPLVRLDPAEPTRPGSPVVGFLVCPAIGRRPAVVLVGTRQIIVGPRVSAPLPVTPDSKLLGVTEPESVFAPFPPFPLNLPLILAIQCKVRGWDSLANALLVKGLGASVGHNSLFYQPTDLPPRSAVAHLAWVHWASELAKPGTDRRQIAKHLQALVTADSTLDTASAEAFLDYLEAALAPSQGLPGTPEALVNELVDMTTGATFRGHRDQTAYSKLADLGFEAVPTLIDHLGDFRLTRTVFQHPTGPAYFCRVDDLVSDLLQELSGESWPKDSSGYYPHSVVTKPTARAWWTRVREMGEETYLLDRVLPAGVDQHSPFDPHLRLLAKKYPHDLTKIYRRILNQRPDIVSDGVARAITGSALPRDLKLKLFQEAAGHKKEEIRRAANEQLKALAAMP